MKIELTENELDTVWISLHKLRKELTEIQFNAEEEIDQRNAAESITSTSKIMDKIKRAVS